MPALPPRVCFNENDRFAAAWLRNLFPRATVLEESVAAVTPETLAPFARGRVHLFGGIGGWELALRCAGWPPGRPVWTGSCPCQPFSVAGRLGGEADPRHLWPEMFRLVRECRPTTVFGEQVANKYGVRWVSGVRTDLEGIGYAVGVADLPACGVGAPFAGQRLYWVAAAGRPGPQERVRDPGLPRPPELPNPWQVAGGRGDVLRGRDGRLRRVEPGTRPLADGVPDRVGRIRAFGNAIVPQVAAAFVRAFLEAEAELDRADD